MSELRTSNPVNISPSSPRAPTLPSPAIVVTGFPGTLASANAQSSRTSRSSRNPEPETAPERVPKNGRVSR